MLKVNVSSLDDVINRVAATNDGKVLLAMLMQECGYHQSLMDSKDPAIAQAHAMKRGIWGKLRQRIKLDALIDIEHKVHFVNETKKKEGKK